MHPIPAILVTTLLVVRAYTRNSLTLPGILTAALTASIHALHPSSLPFALLCTFFLLGTQATKVKHNVKATLTVSSAGSSGGEGPRSAVQVLANSGVASLLTLVHVWRYGIGKTAMTVTGESLCFGVGSLEDLLLFGIVANYAAVTSDTLSSELGILSRSRPRLIMQPWRVVPPGTNGGVTGAGLVSGFGGAFVIGLVSAYMLPFCSHGETLMHIQVIGHQKPPSPVFHDALQSKFMFAVAVATWGLLGSMLDSLLGATLQASVVDKRTGKVVEGSGGTKVLVTPRRRLSSVSSAEGEKENNSRMINSGFDVLDNNQINLLMAFMMSLGGALVGIVVNNGAAVLDYTSETPYALPNF